MNTVPKKENAWVFIMAGQSNMAGRGIVEPEDTMPDKRVLSINKNGELIVAKEPLHWYEPEREIARQIGTIKGILWHQGESDANEKDIPLYKQRLGQLFSKFRVTIGNTTLPVIIGELGSFSENPVNFSLINNAIHDYASEDKNCSVISTKDLKDKGDHLHFNSKGQRTMENDSPKHILRCYNKILLFLNL